MNKWFNACREAFGGGPDGGFGFAAGPAGDGLIGRAFSTAGVAGSGGITMRLGGTAYRRIS